MRVNIALLRSTHLGILLRLHFLQMVIAMFYSCTNSTSLYLLLLLIHLLSTPRLFNLRKHSSNSCLLLLLLSSQSFILGILFLLIFNLLIHRCDATLGLAY